MSGEPTAEPGRSPSLAAYDDVNYNIRVWLRHLIAVRQPAVLYDVGANDGVFARALAAECRHVVAFEPVAAAYARLVDHVSREQLANVRTFEVGLSDFAAERVVHRYSDDTFNSQFARPADELTRYGLTSEGEQTIRLVPGDVLVCEQGLPLPTCIKIDVEGAELFVLRGLASTIRKTRPFIVCEYSTENTRNAGYERTAILRELSGLGYAVRGLFRNRDLSLHDGEDLAHRGVWNLVAIPPEWYGFVTGSRSPTESLS